MLKFWLGLVPYVRELERGYNTLLDTREMYAQRINHLYIKAAADAHEIERLESKVHSLERAAAIMTAALGTLVTDNQAVEIDTHAAPSARYN